VPVGGAIGQVLTKVTASDYNTKWQTPSATYNILDYGGVADGVTNNSPALQTTINAAAPSHAVVYIPAGSWTFASTVTWSDAVALRGEGISATQITYTGTGFWLTCPTFNSFGGGFQDMTVTCSASATGAIQMGSYANRLTGNNQMQSWRNLYLVGPGNSHVGTCGVQMYSLATSLFENISIVGFEMGLLMQTTTVNLGIRIRIFACKYAFNYHREGSVLETSGDRFMLLDLLGPFGTDGTGYAIKCEADTLAVYEAFIEPSATDNMYALVWFTRNGTYGASLSTLVGGQLTLTAGAVVAHPVVIDDSQVQLCGFNGTTMGVSGAGVGPSSCVAVITGQNINNLNFALNCDQPLADSLAATGNILVFGASRTQAGAVLGMQMRTPQLLLAAPVTPGAVSLALGAGGFGGGGAPQFVDGGNGTQIGVNMPAGYAGRLEDFQVAGVSKWHVDATGNTVASGTGTFGGLAVPAGTVQQLRGSYAGSTAWSQTTATWTATPITTGSFTTAGGLLRIEWSVSMAQTTANTLVQIALGWAGSVQLAVSQATFGVANSNLTVSGVYYTTLAAGPQTVTVYVSNNSGSGAVSQTAGLSSLLYVTEQKF
jgi:hypothetical protein